MILTIIVPVYNEAQTVRALLEQVAAQDLGSIKKQVIVVESNSTDNSREICRQFVESQSQNSEGAAWSLICQESPRGKGFALREGLKKATGDIILIQDADLEYNVAEYPQLLAPIVEGRADFVLGSRHLGAGRWKIRKFEDTPFRTWLLNAGGILFHGFFNLLYRTNLTDPTTMFKVFKRECIAGLWFESDRFDFDFELVAKLIRAGYAPFEIPVSYRSRGFAAGKKVRIFRDPLTWMRAIVKYRFAPIREPSNQASSVISSVSVFLVCWFFFTR